MKSIIKKVGVFVGIMTMAAMLFSFNAPSASAYYGHYGYHGHHGHYRHHGHHGYHGYGYDYGHGGYYNRY